MSNLIILAILIAAAILLTWLGLHAWRAKRPFVRWAGAATASVLVVVLCLISGIAVAGLYKMQLRTAPVPDLKVEATSEQLRRGEAITESFCGACHSRTGTLTGGVDIGKDLSPRLGSFVSSNLTPAGPLNQWSEGEIFPDGGVNYCSALSVNCRVSQASSAFPVKPRMAQASSWGMGSGRGNANERRIASAHGSQVPDGAAAADPIRRRRQSVSRRR
jgi:hypothetical protein